MVVRRVPVSAGDISSFAGEYWPELCGVRPTTVDESDLLPIEAIPREYWREAQRLAHSDSLHWRVAFVVDADAFADVEVPAGMKWAGFDAGERVWDATSGYSIISCEVRHLPAFAQWRAELNGLGLYERIETVRAFLVERERLERQPVAERGDILETYFGNGLRIFRIALLADAVPLVA